MMAFNKYFELNVDDIELIENTLRTQLKTAEPEKQKMITDLLARLHHQKTWYRPQGNFPYISG